MSNASPKPASEGRIVHVRHPGVDHCQPAIVVQAWGSGTGALNLVVFRDGSNDIGYGCPIPTDLTRWATSVPYAESAESHAASGFTATWHWPEQVG
jgi:hypothetical protein